MVKWFTVDIQLMFFQRFGSLDFEFQKKNVLRSGSHKSLIATYLKRKTMRETEAMCVSHANRHNGIEK